VATAIRVINGAGFLLFVFFLIFIVAADAVFASKKEKILEPPIAEEIMYRNNNISSQDLRKEKFNNVIYKKVLLFLKHNAVFKNFLDKLQKLFLDIKSFILKIIALAKFVKNI
jgi:hypothetical protein